MKNYFSLCVLGALLVTFVASAWAQPGPRPRRGGDLERPRRPLPTVPETAPVAFQTLKGEAYFLEKIALPPGAQLHVSLVGKVTGAPYLPLGTTVLAAQNGVTPFNIYLPLDLPPAPYRLQAWIVAGNRVIMVGRDAQTLVDTLGVTAKIRLQVAPNSTASAPKPNGITAQGVPAFALNGEVLKLDRRALAPDAIVEITLSDISLADAPEKVLASFKSPLKGSQLPEPFEFGVAKTALLPRHRYNLRARVTEGGKLTYITDTAILVTPENVGQKWQLLVKPTR